MDFSWESAGIGGTSIMIMGIVYKIYTALNHRRLRSNCCGKILVAEIDIDNTTPKEEKEKSIVDGVKHQADSERKQEAIEAAPEDERKESA
jgi:hypothetical protein